MKEPSSQMRRMLSDRKVARLCGLVLAFLMPCCAHAQSRPQAQPSYASSVVDLGQISAKRLSGSLGIGIGPNGLQQNWQFAAAKAMGASWVRIQCGWEAVERQTDAPANEPASPRYVQTPGCIAALNSAAKYGLHVTEVAAYGPAFHLLLLATLPKGAAAGQSSLQVAYAQGVNGTNLSNLKPISDYICPVVLDDGGSVGKRYRCQSALASRGGPPGTLITAVHRDDSTHATLALASALTKAVPADVQSPQHCNIQAGSNVLSCSDGNFSEAWGSGLQVAIPGADARGNLTTITTGVRSATQLTLRRGASRSVDNVAVTAHRLYAVGEILYPSTATDRADDHSVSAYVDYATFLANDMAGHGVSGDIEIWNEPPWRNDSWDFRPGLYDSANSGPFKPSMAYGKGAVVSANGKLFQSLTDHNQGNEPMRLGRFWSADVPSTVFPGEPVFGANFGFAANLQHRHFPSGVTATWDGTSGSGNGSLLGPLMQAYSGEAFSQPPTVVTKESFHPYGGPANNPEDVLMRPDCMQAAAHGSGSIFEAGHDCYLPGERKAANLMQAVEYDITAKSEDPARGIGHSVTETNGSPPGPGLQIAQARFDLRQFLGLASMGIAPIEFFQLWDGAHRDPTYSFVDYDGTAMKPLPVYTVLAGLMSDLHSVGDSEQRVKPAPSFAVTRYEGAYPLALLHVSGTQQATSRSTERLMLWQLSAAPGFTASISGNTLQVTALRYGSAVLAPGELLEGPGVAPGTTITESLTGTGGVGSYRISGRPLNISPEPMNVDWMTLPTPTAGSATVQIPPGWQVSGAINLMTRKQVPYRSSGHELTIAVQDDPIEIVVDAQ